MVTVIGSLSAVPSLAVTVTVWLDLVSWSSTDRGLYLAGLAATIVNERSVGAAQRVGQRVPLVGCRSQ